MDFSNSKRWSDLSPGYREVAFGMILKDNGEASEIVRMRGSRSGFTVYTRLSEEATVVGRMAWGVIWSSRMFLSSLQAIRPDLWHRRPESDGILEVFWSGQPPFIQEIRDQLHKGDQRELALLVQLDDTIASFDAWVEAHHYLQTKQKAISQYFSPASRRILDMFNPFRKTNRKLPNPIVYSGAFEMNRRRH